MANTGGPRFQLGCLAWPVDIAASGVGTWSAELGAITGEGRVGGGFGAVAVLGPPEGLPRRAGVHTFGAALVWASIATALGASLVFFATCSKGTLIGLVTQFTR